MLLPTVFWANLLNQGTARPLPSTASRGEPSAPPAHFSEEMRRIVDQMCQRHYWFMQGDKALKDVERLGGDIKKMKSASTDFHSASSFLESDLKRAEKISSKSSARAAEIDAKVSKAVWLLVARYVSDLPIHKSTTEDTGMSSSKTRQAIADGHIDDKLQKMEERLQSRYDSQLSEMRQELDKSLQRNMALEAKLEKLSQGANESDEKTTKVETTVINLTTEVVRLATAAEGPPQVSEQDIHEIQRQLAELDASIKGQGDKFMATESVLSELQSAVSKCPAEDVAEIKSDLSLLKDQVRSKSQENAPEPGEHARASNSTEVMGKVQMLLNKLASGFGELIDKERGKITVVEGKVVKTQEKVSAIQKTVAEMEPRVMSSTAALQTEVNNQNHNLNALQHNWNATHTGLRYLDEMFKRQSEEVAMQIQCLNAWQNNFTTKDMYKSIVEHITATLPRGVEEQYGALSTRMNSLESRIAINEGSPRKKRKVLASSDSGIAANGNNDTSSHVQDHL